MSTTTQKKRPLTAKRKILSRLLQWEYWPFNLFYAPILPYWIWLMLRTRSFFFFTASNPGIEFGGMLGESKEKILRAINPKYLPTTVKLRQGVDATEVLQVMKKAGLSFPIILKPDIGERGWGVEKIESSDALSDYLAKDWPVLLLQEYIDLPVELGVFYHRKPSMKKGKITSIVQKQMLSVKGNGADTIRELMKGDDRARRYIQSIEKRLGLEIDRIPQSGENVLLVSIGNHSRGTAFLDANHEIEEELEFVFDVISKEIDGFYFGRFDLRCASFEELKQGKNFQIMELNGAGAEPAHVYDPSNSLVSAYRDIIYHLRLLGDISIENMRLGARPMGIADGLKFIRGIKQYNRAYKA